MPSLKDTKRRIVSVRNTQKITHAMKLVSAAKFSRANHAVLAARPYGIAFDRIVGRLAAGVENIEGMELLRYSESPQKILLAMISTDRGLCGSLNTNVFKSAVKFAKENQDQGREVHFAALGKRAGLFCRKLGLKVVFEREKVLERPSYSSAKDISDTISGMFTAGQYDRVILCFPEFRSVLSQSPVLKQLLPVVTPDIGDDDHERLDFIIEPDARSVLESMLRKHVVNTVFRALLEGSASEHGARMTAMDSATKNAKEYIRKLTLQYNRARQAAITKELIEIISGAEAI
jgi:F-type H+-transporting ATPase subunit gamma